MTTTSSACLPLGAWRAWLDGEFELESADRHLPECPACQQLVADLSEANASVRSAFSILAPARLPSAAETALARRRLELRRRLPSSTATGLQLLAPGPAARQRVSTSWRLIGSGLAAMLVLTLVVAFTPQGSAAAAGFLAQFRSQQLVGVEVTPQTQAEMVKTFDALGNLGDLQVPSGLTRPNGASAARTDPTTTVSLSDASHAVGFTIETPDKTTLPPGLSSPPRVRLLPASQIRFTFRKDKARAYYQSTGQPQVTLPDKFDGATLVVSIPSAALLEYGDPGGKDALIVGEAGELVVDVEGGTVSLPEMRDFLLGLPGLPEPAVSQLKQIQNWNETLPIPIPVDKVSWQSGSFNGNEGLLLNDNSGIGSAAIWNASGRLYGVAGSLRAKDLQVIADSLGPNH